MSKISYYDHIRLRAVNPNENSEDTDLDIQIVPAHEADAVSGRISEDAPVGQAVLHRKPGDTVTIRAQGKSFPMRIITVEKHVALA